MSRSPRQIKLQQEIYRQQYYYSCRRIDRNPSPINQTSTMECSTVVHTLHTLLYSYMQSYRQLRSWVGSNILRLRSPSPWSLEPRAPVCRMRASSRSSRAASGDTTSGDVAVTGSQRPSSDGLDERSNDDITRQNVLASLSYSLLS